MNKISNHGGMIEIHSHINNEAIQIIEKLSDWSLERIQFDYTSVEPNESDMKVLNNYFKNHKKVFFCSVEKWMIPLLPELERFYIESRHLDAETVELLKGNKVTGLRIEYSPHKKYDLMNLLHLKDTLEELSVEGNYKNLEQFVNEAKKIHTLTLHSLSIDFTKIEEIVIEEFNYYGSKAVNWAEITKLKKLKRIGIHTNTKLDSLDFLTEMENLEVIALSYCPKITTLPNLTCLKKLKMINCAVLNGLDNVDELKKMENIVVQADGYKFGTYHNYPTEDAVQRIAMELKE